MLEPLRTKSESDPKLNCIKFTAPDMQTKLTTELKCSLLVL